MIGRPASLQTEEGSSDKESWSVVHDRIDGWWKRIPPRDSRRRVLVRDRQGVLRHGPTVQVPDHKRHLVRALHPTGLNEARCEEKLPMKGGAVFLLRGGFRSKYALT